MNHDFKNRRDRIESTCPIDKAYLIIHVASDPITFCNRMLSRNIPAWEVSYWTKVREIIADFNEENEMHELEGIE